MQIAVIDYGLGNLFSIKHAFSAAGEDAEVTSSASVISAADAVVLPGVGAFGNAMESLRRLDLVSPIRDFASSGRPLIGICLGMQLLMSESCEFGRHEGLGLIKGDVVRLENPKDPGVALKVPEVGWNSIYRAGRSKGGEEVLSGVRDGAYMYFVHSYYVRPQDNSVAVTVSHYGDIEFCSSLRSGNIIAFQFHPERSGKEGLLIYRNLSDITGQNKERKSS